MKNLQVTRQDYNMTKSNLVFSAGIVERENTDPKKYGYAFNSITRYHFSDHSQVVVIEYAYATRPDKVYEQIAVYDKHGSHIVSIYVS